VKICLLIASFLFSSVLRIYTSFVLFLILMKF
jgi:hypothetical protein